MSNKMINRIKSTSLNIKDGECFYQNSLFTGVAVDINQQNGLVLDMTLYTDGRPDGQYKGKYLDYSHKVLLDAARLEETEDSDNGEPVYYNKEKFTGIVFEFDEGYCLTESEYQSGYLLGSVENDGSGNLYYLGLYNYDDRSQIYEWHKNGNLKKLEIHGKCFNITFIANEENTLKSLGINGDYFQQLEKIKDKIAFPFIDKPAIFYQIQLGDWLFINGNFITDDFFDIFLQNPAINNVKELHIMDTAMTETSFSKIATLKNLKVVAINSMKISDAILEKIKEQLPDCKITSERREIVISNKK